MISRYHHEDIQWVDVLKPHEKELSDLANEFSLHPLVVEELRSPSFRSRVDTYEDSAYLILHFPAFGDKNGENPNQEVDFIITKNSVITVRYSEITALKKFADEFEIFTSINKDNAPIHAGYLFYALMKALYRSLEGELEQIENRLEEAEEKIFQGQEGRMVAYLSKISRDLLNFKQGTRPHKEVIESLKPVWKSFYGEDFLSYLEAIEGSHYKISNALENHKETLIDLRETNDSLLSAKTSGIMKTLTIITFSTFPPLLVAGMFSMNSPALPLVSREDGFWIILSLMILSSAATFGFFVHKKWL